MGEAHYYSKLIWSGSALGPTESVETYSREFRAEIDGKPPLRGSAPPEFHGDPTLYTPEDLLMIALPSCHMLSYLAVCAHAGIRVVSYEDSAVGTLGTQGGESQVHRRATPTEGRGGGGKRHHGSQSLTREGTQHLCHRQFGELPRAIRS